MNRIRFVTLYPRADDRELVKDVGQIPYVLGLNYNDIDTYLATYDIDINGENFKNLKELKVITIPKLFKSMEISGLVYLLFNSRKIEWLNIYHAGRRSLIWAKVFKSLNPKGKIYLKLDLDFRGCDLYDSSINEREIFKKNTKIADIISAESTAVINRIQKYSVKKMLLIEDGISELRFRPKIDGKRENTFITVGRLGTHQKATDILLEAFAKSSTEHAWNLVLIGSIEDSFRSYIDNYFMKYPNLIERVTFKGVINDREMLYKEYCNAKVFLLPSRWESFGISSGEALSCGCHLILSDSIPPANVMTDNGKYGRIVETENIELLSEALIEATREDYLQNKTDEISAYAYSLFSWNRICYKLFEEMMRVNNG